MVEIKEKNYWNMLSKKGEVESELRSQLDQLFVSFLEVKLEDIFHDDSNEFLESFQTEIETKLTELFSQYQGFTPSENSQKKERFFSQLREHLILIHRKQALCEITFEAFSLFELIKTFSEILDEATLDISENEVIITIMDSSRICLMRTILKNNTYKLFQKGKIGVNLDDFKKVLACKKSDNSTTTLIFGKEYVFITITSKTYSSEITRKLQTIDLDMSEIPLNLISQIIYPFEFSIPPEKFLYMLSNANVYSEIVSIIVNPSEVIFQEIGQIGSGEIKFTKEHLIGLSFYPERIQKELKNNMILPKEKNVLHSILDTSQCQSSYSLTFLNWIGKMGKIVDKNTPLKFSHKSDVPLKAELQFNKLGKSSTLFFLAPRADSDDDNDDFDDIDNDDSDT